MFEIGIFSVIILAVSYWAVLWVMGRREDVLHGEFVKADGQPAGETAQTVVAEPAVRPIFPDPAALAERPVFPERTTPRPAPAKRPIHAERIALPDRVTAEPARRVAAPEQPAFRPERMQELLASIKQDLNQLVQK